MMEQEERTLEELSRIGTESETPAQMPEEGTQICQTETELQDSARDPIPQDVSAPKRRGTRKKKAADADQSGENPSPVEDAPTVSVRKKRADSRTASVVSIDRERTVETDADRARDDLLDLLESQKTGRILSGTVQGVEERGDGNALAVLYHGAFKVLLPAKETVNPPEDFRDRSHEEVFRYLLTKRLGAEVDYIVKGIDAEADLAVGSRLEAMRAKRKQYYFGTDREGKPLLDAGTCAEARVVSVIRAGIFVDLFGLEVYIPLRELSYQRLMDAAGRFQPGQRILVRLLEVDRTNPERLRVAASVKQASDNPYEKVLSRYTVGNRYVGSVSLVDTHGVFVALDGGIDCLCAYPKRGRPPRGARVTVRILGIDRETNRIWGAITHAALPR